MWVLLGVISSLFLGIYNIVKKHSVNDNNVIKVLIWATISGALLFIPLIAGSFLNIISVNSVWYVPLVSFKVHLLIILKSCIVGTSWLFAYYGLKHLPITIVTPIRSTAPVWTLIGAIFIYKEQFNVVQWIGLIVTLFFFYMFTLLGKKEGIHFRANKWVWFIICATLIGAISTLYDKYLILNYPKMTIQSWFSVYLVPFMYLSQKIINTAKNSRGKVGFEWRWTIPLIGLLLVLADFAYFTALSLENSSVAILSVLRRSSVVYTFLIGAAIFKDKNVGAKWMLLLGILAGVFLIVFGS